METETEEITALTPIDAVAAVPWLGGPVSNVLSGMSVGRKIRRVEQVLRQVSEDLKQFKSEASEKYVQTEECRSP